MKNLLVISAILCTLLPTSSEARSSYRALGGMDTSRNISAAFEIDQRNMTYGVQLYVGKSEEEHQSAVYAAQATQYTLNQQFTQDNITLYGGYPLETGLMLKGGLTMTLGNMALSGTLIDGESNTGFTTFRPFIGSSYPLSRYWNVNIHYTFGGSEVLEVMSNSNIGTIVNLEDNLAILVGMQF